MTTQTVAEQMQQMIDYPEENIYYRVITPDRLRQWIKEIEEEKEQAAEEAIAASSLDSFGGYSIVP